MTLKGPVVQVSRTMVPERIGCRKPLSLRHLSGHSGFLSLVYDERDSMKYIGCFFGASTIVEFGSERDNYSCVHLHFRLTLNCEWCDYDSRLRHWHDGIYQPYQELGYHFRLPI
jgi:hypothetical protein